jgi:ABC-type antimicrobial peptide transport system permease subunit
LANIKAKKQEVNTVDFNKGRRFKTSRDIFNTLGSLGKLVEVVSAVVLIISVIGICLAINQQTPFSLFSCIIVAAISFALLIAGLIIVAFADKGLISIETENNTRIIAEETHKLCEMFSRVVDKKA